jgi:DNA-directed RNA polymerase specialized sigma24 family protein
VAKDRDWRDRGHFFAFSARAMRRYLIDYARRRGGNQFVPMAELENLLRSSGSKVQTALTVATLLDELEQTQPELCTIVEMKFFLGLSDQDAADAMGLKLRSLQRRWQDARRWMFERL